MSRDRLVDRLNVSSNVSDPIENVDEPVTVCEREDSHVSLNENVSLPVRVTESIVMVGSSVSLMVLVIVTDLDKVHSLDTDVLALLEEENSLLRSLVSERDPRVGVTVDVKVRPEIVITTKVNKKRMATTGIWRIVKATKKRKD